MSNVVLGAGDPEVNGTAHLLKSFRADSEERQIFLSQKQQSCAVSRCHGDARIRGRRAGHQEGLAKKASWKVNLYK